MYQALYRKYRPKTLDDICGQKIIVTIIKNAIKKSEINHAYLFAGPRGTGKTSLAKIFAKIVNCSNRKDCIPCGKCQSCIEKNNNDIIEIDAASNNGVDEIRELRNKVNLVPSYGKYKVYIIDEVHMLTVGAFNALLKTLEEPPAHVIFILATTDPQKIPETILSRCQKLDFKKISNEEIVENLRKISEKENIKIEDDALYEIAKLSDGGMRDSVGLLDQAKTYTNEKITIKDIHDINGTLTNEDLYELVKNVSENNLEKILEKTDLYNAKGKNFIKLNEELIYFIRDIILYKKVPNYFQINKKNISIYEKLANKISTSELFHYIEVFNKYSFEMKTTNNTKLMFELAFIKIISESEIKTKENVEIKNEEKSNEKVQENNNQKGESNNKKEYEEKKLNKENIIKNNTKKIQENKEIQLQLKEIKRTRIDNTLSKFNKMTLLEIKQKLEMLNELLLNPEYSHSASILLDGILKAASDENLIFVYNTSRIANLFNENLIILEKTIEKILNKKYKLIATDNEDWEIIKDEFNNKKRQFVYHPEDYNIEEIYKKETNEIASMFEEIIEYN